MRVCVGCYIPPPRGVVATTSPARHPSYHPPTHTNPQQNPQCSRKFNSRLDMYCMVPVLLADISKNQIEILSEGTVAQLGDIEVLDASSNKISVLPGLIPLISLTHLDLR